MIDLFDKQICVDCGKPCHFGTGRFVNRYPAYNNNKEGYRCGECACEVEKLYGEDDDIETSRYFYDDDDIRRRNK